MADTYWPVIIVKMIILIISQNQNMQALYENTWKKNKT